jgi:membrane-bound lytic murein transglycosylase F
VACVLNCQVPVTERAFKAGEHGRFVRPCNMGRATGVKTASGGMTIPYLVPVTRIVRRLRAAKTGTTRESDPLTGALLNMPPGPIVETVQGTVLRASIRDGSAPRTCAQKGKAMPPKLIRATDVAKAKVCTGAALSLILLGGVGCEQLSMRNALEAIRARGELRVLTREDGTCYYRTPSGPAGLEYELAKAFADHLGVKLKLVVTENSHDMVPALLRGEADIIAAGFPVTKRLKSHLAFGPPYMEVTPQVVGRRGGPSPRALPELIGQSLWVNGGTSYEELLREQKAHHPDLSWFSVRGYETEELLEMVARGIIPLTVADSNVVGSVQSSHPQIVALFPLAERAQLAWAMDPHCRELQATVHQWFKRPDTAAFLQGLNQRYYGHLRLFNYVDLATYHRKVRERLPKYRRYFEAAGTRYGLDWRLVAALAYQESQWDPEAESFTGVRGLMMLTRTTGDEMGVSSRLDPVEAIFAGARYFAHLHKRIGAAVPESDRTDMALAAYNVGWGHLEDARMLAQRLGKNPNVWPVVRATLPLLRNHKFYESLPHGYARGAEPVRFVDCIKTYYSILVQATDELVAQREKAASRDKTDLASL